MDSKEVQETISKLELLIKKVKDSSPSFAKDLLRQAGILTKSGKISRHYK